MAITSLYKVYLLLTFIPKLYCTLGNVYIQCKHFLEKAAGKFVAVVWYGWDVVPEDHSTDQRPGLKGGEGVCDGHPL